MAAAEFAVSRGRLLAKEARVPSSTAVAAERGVNVGTAATESIEAAECRQAREGIGALVGMEAARSCSGLSLLLTREWRSPHTTRLGAGIAEAGIKVLLSQGRRAW